MPFVTRVIYAVCLIVLVTAVPAQRVFGPDIEDCDRAIDQNPKDVEAYRNRASAYCRYGEYDRALADLTMAIELKPTRRMGIRRARRGI
jgi:tetratricopeptide (TPR) repeat protein